MTLTITTLLVIAVASIILNVVQYNERRMEKQETKRFIADNAALEIKLDEITAKYDNECKHREWAIGRIKDQQTVINQLERNIKPKRAYRRKEGENV